MKAALKRLLIGPYYYASAPLRRRRNAAAAAAGRAPVMLVYYHRIADRVLNDWTVSNRAFRRHIRWMQSHFELVSLEEAQRRVRAPRNDRPSVSITFDDGYAENCEQALPFLLDEGVPFTYFVTANNVLHGAPFSHDVALNRPLAPNTPEQLRELAAAGVEIGAHTRTHADLGALTDLDAMYDEVVGARDDLQGALGVPIRYFAFPFGLHANLHPQAFAMAREAGIEAVVSAYGGYNYPGDDAFHLQRIGGEGPLVRLKNWLTVDPRKVQITRRYEYDVAAPKLVGATAE